MLLILVALMFIFCFLLIFSQSEDSKTEQVSAKKSSYNEIKMEDIFGERKAFIDGEELIEVVDTYPKGKINLCIINNMNSHYLSKFIQ